MTMQERGFCRMPEKADTAGMQRQIRELSGEKAELKRLVSELREKVADLSATIENSDDTIRKSEIRYRTIFENNGTPTFIVNKDTSLALVNREAEKLLGYSREEMEGGMSWTDFIVDEASLEKMRLYHEGRRESGGADTPDQYVARGRTKSGEIKEVIFSVVMIPGTSQSLVSLLDITEQRRLEERLIQAQKMESVGTLAGGVAHDFNNLLMAVLGNVSILKEQPDTDALQKRLRHIEQYVNAGIDLTRQLLGFARGGKYDPRPVSLNELVEKSASLFGRTRKEVCMHFSLEENVWTVQADPSQMEQVLLNLYVNAWQAMTGGGDIFINSKNMVLEEKDVKPWKAVPGKYVRLSVTDTGCGMDEATMQQVFDPFFTTKQKERGTGLGLASVYGIVQNHGGFITVYSLPDQGSTFNIYLPVAEQEAEALLRSGVSEDEGFFYGCETILLVDDEQIVLDVCKDMLEGLGYRVYPADSGSKAIRLYREKTEEIDAVLLDFTMPEVSGEETFRQLQAIDPGVRVLVSSGFSLNRQVQNLLEQGVAGFIQKPFNLRGLSRKLQEILK